MYNLENLTSEITRYLESERAYLNAGFDSLPTAELDALRRAYDDAAHSVAFHAQIVSESLASLTYPASDASQFLIPPHDQMPDLASYAASQMNRQEWIESDQRNAGLLHMLDEHDYAAQTNTPLPPLHQDQLRQMFDEPELPAGGYDTCRDCGERRSLDEFARCAKCAALRLGTPAQCCQNDPDCPNTGWPVPCSKCNFCSQNPDELAQSDESQEEHTLYVADGEALYRLKVANGHVRVEKRQPTEAQLTYELNVWGRTLHYDHYWDLAVIREVINRYDLDIIDLPDESQDDDSSEWLTAATELGLASQVSDSRDYPMDDDDYDDEWYEDDDDYDDEWYEDEDDYDDEWYEDEDDGWWLTDEALEELASSEDDSDTSASTGAATDVSEIPF